MLKNSEKDNAARNKKIRLIVAICCTVITLFLTATLAFFVIVQSFFKQKALDIVGFRTFIVSYTGSMEPVLQYNDLIFVKKVDFDQIKEGDIITFHGYLANGKDMIIITHRVIKVNIDDEGRRCLYTMGDNAEGRDYIPVTVDGEADTNIYIGKMTHKSTFFGNVLAFLGSGPGFAVLIIYITGTVLIFILNAWYKSIEEKNAARQNDVQPPPDSDGSADTP